MKERAVPKVEGYASVHGQVLDSVHVTHFNDEVIHGLKRDQAVLWRKTAHFEEVSDNALQFRMVKPRHLGYFGNQNHDHLENFLLAPRTFLDQEIDQVVLDLQLLTNFDLEPVFNKDFLDAVGSQILRVGAARVV